MSATGSAGYRRSAGSPRGLARRRELLERITDDLAVHGLTDFSLRRAARSAGTTHKVLLYHFESAEALLAECVRELRARRITKGLQAAARHGSLSARVGALWPAVAGGEARTLDEAMGLAMYDPERHHALAADATAQYLPALIELCPPHWPTRRKTEVAQLILAALRGFLVTRLTDGGEAARVAGFRALRRALDREEAAD